MTWITANKILNWKDKQHFIGINWKREAFAMAHDALSQAEIWRKFPVNIKQTGAFKGRLWIRHILWENNSIIIFAWDCHWAWQRTLAMRCFRTAQTPFHIIRVQSDTEKREIQRDSQKSNFMGQHHYLSLAATTTTPLIGTLYAVPKTVLHSVHPLQQAMELPMGPCGTLHTSNSP